MDEEGDLSLTEEGGQFIKSAGMIVVAVGQGDGLHRAQIHSQDFGVVGGASFGKTEIEQQGMRLAVDTGLDNGGKPVFRQDRQAEATVLKGDGPGYDGAVVRGRHLDIVVLKGQDLYYVHRFQA